MCDNNNNYSQPPSVHTEIQKYKLIYMLWLNFILGLNFIFCFKLIINFNIIHHHTQKPTYLGSMKNCLSKKAEMPTCRCRSWRLSLFHFPLPLTFNSPTTPTTPPPCPQNDPAALGELCEVWSEVVALSSQTIAI